MAVINDPNDLDATNLLKNTTYKTQELADFIRTKKYGVDVRESIAQSFERTHEALEVTDDFSEEAIARAASLERQFVISKTKADTAYTTSATAIRRTSK